MHLRKKQKLDTTLGTPLLVLTWIAVRLASKILHRSHAVLPVKRIVVLKFQGMGSLVMAKPALAQLREWYPKAKIIFWGTKETAAFAKLCPEFDQVLVLRDESLITAFFSALGSLVRLMVFRADWAIDLEVYSKLSTVLTSFTLARNRLGFAVDAVSLRRNCHTHLLLFNRYRYLGEAYLRLVGLMRPANAPTKVSLLKTGSLKREINRTPEKPLFSTEYIVFHLHSGPLAPERKWPLEHWIELLRKIQSAEKSEDRNSQRSLVLTGKGPSELKIADRFVQLAEEEGFSIPIHNLTGQLTLIETIEVLRSAEITVSADTAIPHLAVLVGTPAIGLFGPTRPETYFPPQSSGLPYVAVTKNLYCSPCVHHWPVPPCDGRFECMKLITPEEVLREMYAILSQANDFENVHSSWPPIDLAANDFPEGKLFAKD